MSKYYPIPCSVCGAMFMRRGGSRHCSLRCRFVSRVDAKGPTPAHRPELGPCHVWTGTLDAWGYGIIKTGGKAPHASRVAWMLADGDMPAGHVLHHCDNPACVNRAHLFEGDDASNAADRTAKGRSALGNRNGTHLYPDRVARGVSHPRAKLTEDDVREIRRAHAEGATLKRLGARYGMNHTGIGFVVRRVTWKHVA